MSIWVVLLSLIFLYASNRAIVIQITRLVHKIGGGKRAFIWLWSVIFLPGTIIHEMSHFLAAAATGAKTGKVEVLPEILEKNWESETSSKGAVLGYVQVQKLDPIRGFLVGMAPFFVGLSILIWLASLLGNSYSNQSWPLFIFEIYIFFTLANSFFPSWTDIKQVLPLVIILIFAGILAIFFGLQLHFTREIPQIQQLISSLGYALLISVIINFLAAGFLFIINQIF